MNPPTKRFAAALARYGELAPDERRLLRDEAAALRLRSLAEADELLLGLAEWTRPLPAAGGQGPRIEVDPALLGPLVAELERFFCAGDGPRRTASEHTPARLHQLYSQLRGDAPHRSGLLRALAALESPVALAAFVELVLADPPATARDCGLAFSPLFRRPPLEPEHLFPRLLEGLGQPHLAPLVLDLANFLSVRRLISPHPAAERRDELVRLLGNLGKRLAKIESPSPGQSGEVPAPDRVADGIALFFSLCRTLSLLGGRLDLDLLRPALAVGHRRLRAELAALMARQGDAAALEVLAELAAEPVVRRQVLGVLEELNQLDRVPPGFRTPEALALGDVSAWLSLPQQFGVAPTSLELLDSRRQYWPGYEEPQECFLCRFAYDLPKGRYENLALAGPVTHAMACDLRPLAVDDVYALFAGWFAEHDEIRETAADALDSESRARWEQVRQELEAAGYAIDELVKLGEFFGDETWVVSARRGGQPGVLIASGTHHQWHPTPSGSRPLGPDEVYWLHCGRKLLAAFNPSGR